MAMIILRIVLGILTFVSLSGCASSIDAPDLGGLYDRAAREHDLLRNPVIVIPGVLGTKLIQSGTDRTVWGAFAGGYANPETDDGARLVGLPMAEGVSLAELRDDVVPNGALDRVKVEVLGLPVELDAYLQILGTLGVGGYRDQSLGDADAIDYGDDHYTCFQFDYDWRRDNVENAHRLLDFMREKRAYVQEELRRRYGIENAEVKFDIVAHSMGGLLTRYMLRFGDADLPADGSAPTVTWAGAEYVERAILVGTPNAGSTPALVQLTAGTKLAFFLPRYESALLGTMPAVYQLLPRPRHGAVRLGDAEGETIDILDPAVWERYQWGLADPDQDATLQRLLPDAADSAERRRIALDHLRKCLDRTARLAVAIDIDAEPPDGLELYLIAGDAEDTPAVLAVDEDGSLQIVGKAPGDGTVLRSSALMDERLDGDWSRMIRTPIAWRQVTFLFRNHLDLTKDPAFADNVLYVLLEAPR